MYFRISYIWHFVCSVCCLLFPIAIFLLLLPFVEWPQRGAKRIAIKMLSKKELHHERGEGERNEQMAIAFSALQCQGTLQHEQHKHQQQQQQHQQSVATISS